MYCQNSINKKIGSDEHFWFENGGEKPTFFFSFTENNFKSIRTQNETQMVYLMKLGEAEIMNHQISTKAVKSSEIQAVNERRCGDC